jgi:hypothetical protein
MVAASVGVTGQVAAEASEIVASFTGGEITRADLESTLRMKLPFERARITAPTGPRSVLESMLRYDLLVLEAQRRGYRDDWRVRDAARAQANDALIRAEASVEPTTLSAAELKPLLETQQRELSRPALRRASQVVVATREQAQALITELKGASREHFAHVATERSQDPKTRHQGGELGYFDGEGKSERGVRVVDAQPLVAATFQLRQVGDIAPQPIEVPGGFSVLMLTGQMQAAQPSAAEVDERVRDQLARTKSVAKLDAFVAELRAKYKPVVHESLVDLVVFPPLEPAQIPSGFPAAPPDPRQAPKVIEPDGY